MSRMKKLYIISLAIILLFGAELRAQDFDINVDSLAAAHFSVDSLSDDVIDRYDMKKRRRILISFILLSKMKLNRYKRN